MPVVLLDRVFCPNNLLTIPGEYSFTRCFVLFFWYHQQILWPCSRMHKWIEQYCLHTDWHLHIFRDTFCAIHPLLCQALLFPHLLFLVILFLIPSVFLEANNLLLSFFFLKELCKLLKYIKKLAAHATVTSELQDPTFLEAMY